ncbi:hypothetical protein RF11_06228 [Thelohanellus kitauei]|uniref:Uncharacterized protein n=1 Tax=Thelohanellus kitauei TaxID=669202 RepID=A0A0C2MPY3_THEKT|nr:hypothetical protein RF11_06228 [Thelohanellus kitauei]
MATPLSDSFIEDQHLNNNSGRHNRIKPSIKNIRLGFSVDTIDKPRSCEWLSLVSGAKNIYPSSRRDRTHKELCISTNFFIFDHQLPCLDEISDIIQNRIKIISLGSGFLDIPEPVLETPIGLSIHDVMSHELDYSKQFMVLLIEKLKELKLTNYRLTHPDSVKTDFRKLIILQEQSSIESFILNNVISCPGSFISVEDILTRFIPGF